MWAQIVKTRMKAGIEADMAEVREQMRSRISSRQGLVKSYWMRSKSDPQEYYTFVVFESEEAARAGEADLDTDPLFQRVRSLGEGMPEFVDLEVVETVP